MRSVRTAMLDVAYEEHGPSDGDAVVLLHGFPYDPRCYDAIAPVLGAEGYRVVVPYLRGYGPTRFLSDTTMRSGQQAALGRDLLDLLDALSIPQAAMVGYDWGGRAACVVAALWPDRVRCLVSGDGYNIHDIASFAIPEAPEVEYRNWYQFYFHSARGRAGLAANRRELTHLLWRLWSPTWRVDDATHDETAGSFDNPDFVDVVVHSYRHRYGYAAGDPVLEPIEAALAGKPVIAAPTISLSGMDDGVSPPLDEEPGAHLFTGRYERRLLPGIGHNIPQEAPEAVLSALRELLSASILPAEPDQPDTST
jgi:pimeloyl-ACP methyl ester carboxylesterase